MRDFDLDDSLADAAVYVISVAAELAGMHPQTLRQYDRLGLVTPQRTRGRGRRYSRRDVAALREVQRLSQEEGINLAGIAEIMRLRREARSLAQENARLRATLAQVSARESRVFAAGPDGQVLQVQRGTRGPAPRSSREAEAVRRALLAGRSPLALTFYRRGSQGPE